ncbi:uncharacterized protein [Pagrus major]|uniref:uncharacterized protein n=1 Tax=Pagrus major TaxID=143350 RepID=UPI003CC8AC1B
MSMSVKTLESKWKTALTSILEELTESQFKKMLFDLDKIPQGVKSDKVREEIPQIIIEHFGTEQSITVIEKQMKQIPRMDAAVQDLLRPFVDKLKKQQQKKKEAASKAAAAAASGSVDKKQKPAADQQKSCKPKKADPVEPVKPKQKKTQKQDLSLKPAGSTETSKADPVEPVKPKQKKTQKQDLSLKPAGSTKTSKADPVEPVKPKQKKTEKQESNGSTKTSKAQSAAVQPGTKKTAGIKKAI